MDTLRIAVTPTSAEPFGFQVELWVNDVEMTSKGAGLGMDPYAVLVPVNRFVPSGEPTTVPVARCECGVYGCGVTDVRIAKTSRGIEWEWLGEKPMGRAVHFEEAAYLEEVERVSADHSWETPVRTAGRLVLTGVRDDELPSGLRFDWLGNNWRRQESFQVCLRHLDRHQIFLSFEWQDRSPEELAAAVRAELVGTPPEAWEAEWSAMQRSDAPPPMAGASWRPYQH